MPTFCIMDFARSSQARSWIFNEHTLSICRKTVAAIDAREPSKAPKVRKFASGFHRRYCSKGNCALSEDADIDVDIDIRGCNSSNRPIESISSKNQESLIRFHANQIQTLVGPRAIFPELRRNVNVLASAITLFRRFYLSNSTLDFDPRRIAAAAAFLAAKVEEQKVQLGLLAHATKIIYFKVQESRLYSGELRPVSVQEIEAAERDLLKGLNYELVCHLPTGAIRGLTSELLSLRIEQERGEFYPSSDMSGYRTSQRRCKAAEMRDKSMSIVLKALAYSDAPFMFNPFHIAFAATILACGPMHEYEMDDFVRRLFPTRPIAELMEFQEQISKLTQLLISCPAMRLRKISNRIQNKQRSEYKPKTFCTVMENLPTARRVSINDEDNFSERNRKRQRCDYQTAIPQDWPSKRCGRVTPV